MITQGIKIMKTNLSICPICNSRDIVNKKMINSDILFEHCNNCCENFYGSDAMEYFQYMKKKSQLVLK